MSNGDPIKAGQITSAQSTTDLVGESPDISLTKDFVGDVIFRVAPQIGGGAPRRVIGHPVDGIQGFATDDGKSFAIGVAGFGSPNGGTGVKGLGGAFMQSGRQLSGGIGVHGVGGDGGAIAAGTGVLGVGGAPGGVGVFGVAGGPADGVVGLCGAINKSGVFGVNSSTTGSAAGVTGRCDSPAGAGIAGWSAGGVGVVGNSTSGAGVKGEVTNGFGIVGIATNVGFSGFFGGAPLFVNADLMVIGAKSAVVPHADGSHRRLYSLECPESWFEDFGEGKLVNGKAEVKLDTDFAAVIRAKQYHVFITPYGDSRGLYVTKRTNKGFEVQEQQHGTSNVKFSYRVVAKRKDIKGERLKKVSIPHSPPELSDLPKLTRPELPKLPNLPKRIRPKRKS